MPCPRCGAWTQTLRMCHTSAYRDTMTYPRTSPPTGPRRGRAYRAGRARTGTSRASRASADVAVSMATTWGDVAGRISRTVVRLSPAPAGPGHHAASPGGEGAAAVDLGVGQPGVDRPRRQAGPVGDPPHQGRRAAGGAPASPAAARAGPGRAAPRRRPPRRRRPATRSRRGRRARAARSAAERAAGAISSRRAPPAPARVGGGEQLAPAGVEHGRHERRAGAESRIARASASSDDAPVTGHAAAPAPGRAPSRARCAAP